MDSIHLFTTIFSRIVERELGPCQGTSFQPALRRQIKRGRSKKDEALTKTDK